MPKERVQRFSGVQKILSFLANVNTDQNGGNAGKYGIQTIERTSKEQEEEFNN
jgi:hypothetical protein